eukprot:CAMPEP_0117537176 /NCGR_PEP_ID=MMETSP0784-20121206/41830_1 /TAXON_ID=39447 /ORGANISM="" /LENGTH=376 /DNA_ID=CAMNT_0005333755 /DNA_START=78 /DNA_END=1208 /DNA_ORIENTATION=-
MGASFASEPGADEKVDQSCKPRSWHKHWHAYDGQNPVECADAEDCVQMKQFILPGALRCEDFRMLGILGTGTFACVRLAVHTPSSIQCAIKVLRKDDAIAQGRVDACLREKRVLYALDHPFIERLYGHFQDPRCLYFALEYVPAGELFALLRTQGYFTSSTARFYCAQVVCALEHMHDKEFIYRGLKPEDILLDGDGFIKLVDMGFARELPESGLTHTLCGTPEYASPEVLLNHGHGKPADWWGLGVLAFEMMVGIPPFTHENPMEVFQQVIRGKIFRPPGRRLDAEPKSFVQALLRANPQERLGGGGKGASEVKRARWFGDMHWDDLLNRRISAPYVPPARLDCHTDGCSATVGEEIPEAAELPPGVEDVFEALW